MLGAAGACELAPAAIVPVSEGGTYLAGGPVPLLPPGGVRYLAVCPNYTSPLTSACTNASDPRSGLCAWGAGRRCAPCPPGGLCPGGFRLWSRRGFYVASELSVAAQPCLPPATDRCMGWDASLGGTACGPAYWQGSALCASCATGEWGRRGDEHARAAYICVCAVVMFGTESGGVQCSFV